MPLPPALNRETAHAISWRPQNVERPSQLLMFGRKQVKASPEMASYGAASFDKGTGCVENGALPPQTTS